MADRFPLILNTSANQIQEIASGDTLDLSGNNVKGVGIITATNISGNIIAGAGTSNIVSGIITAVAADIDDFVDVGSNIQLGNAGVITATTFKGDGDFVELDVDGHTNLDNVSIAGVTTIASNTTIGGNLTVNGTNTILNTTTYVKGGEGAAGILAIYADEGDDNADKFRFISDTDGTLKLDNYADGSWETNIKAVGNAGVHLYNNNVEVAYTNNQGLYITNTGAEAVLRVLSPSGYHARIDMTADTHANEDNYRIEVNTDQKFRVYGKPGGNYTSFIELDQAGQVTLTRDLDVARHLDVDGHTDLDNVSIAGVSTFAGNADFSSGIDVTGNATVSGTSHFVGVANFNETIVGTARTAIKLTCTDESTDTTTYPLFVAATTGDQFPKTGTNLTFNSASGLLAATQLSGTLQTAAQPNITSVGTLSSLNVSGNLSVGGVLTYEDVTNVDSVGIVTARQGIEIKNDTYKLRTGAELEMQVWHDGTNSIIKDTRDSGKVRIQADNFDIIDKDASTTVFSAAPGGISSPKIHTFSAGATVSGGTLYVGSSSYGSSLGQLRIINDASSTPASLSLFGHGNTTTGDVFAKIDFASQENGTAGQVTAGIEAQAVGSAERAADLVFKTRPDTSGSSASSKFRIRSTGHIGVGVDDPAVAGGYHGMEIGGSDNSGLRLSTTSNGGWAYTDYEINGTQAYIVGCKGGSDSLSSASSWRICSGASFDANQLFVVNANGSVLPGSDNTQDFGSSSFRWANIYTGDLNLSNEGTVNDVDGTWGNFQIQEGENDLFLINKRNGKKYKFNLTEV